MSPEEKPQPELKIGLLGTFSFDSAGQPLAPLRSRKGLWLLALLLLRNGQDVARDWLSGTLWPDNDESQALAYLRREIYLLKQALGKAAERLLSPTSRTLRFDVTGAFVDVIAFDTAIRQEDTTSLEMAVALYRGSLLEGCDEEWAITERRVREQAFLQALETLAERAIAQGKPTAALPHLRRLIQQDPLRESAHRCLLRALAEDGDYAAMMMAYRDLRLLLRQEVLADPAPETVALYEQLRAQAHQKAALTKVESILPSPTPTREGASASPLSTSSKASQTSSSRIPHPLTPLIGRSDVVQNTLGCLATARLVTLTGSGGVGKTRIAIAVAQHKSEDEKVWFVELAALTSPTDVPLAVAKALGIPEQRNIPVEETLVRFLSSSSALLVLDNCEHLLDACAQLCTSLLHTCPLLRILTTSRQSLGMLGEVAYPIPSLSLPPLSLRETSRKPLLAPPARKTQENAEPDKGLLSILMEYEAVNLWVKRAQATSPSFFLTQQNASTVIQICRHLDGIPLAIELAAARVKSLSVEQISARLEHRFRLLSGGNRAALPRHQTLRALIDWSYDLLTAPEKTLLSRLSVFVGGWTLESAEAVCSGEALTPDAILLLLEMLVDKSLVVTEEKESGAVRYRLLETVRQYSAEKLQEAGEEFLLRVRHGAHFLQLVEEAEPQLRGPQQTRWLNRLEAEHDNFRAALEWNPLGKEEADLDSSFALRLTGALARYWDMRGYLTEGWQHLTQALAQAGAEEPSAARAKALRGAALLARHRSDYAVARTLLEESLAIEQDLGNRSAVGELLLRLAQVAHHREEYIEARTLLKEALLIGQETSNRWLVFRAHMALGLAAGPADDYKEAQTELKQALEIARELDDPEGITTTLSSLGQIASLREDYVQARPLLEEALRLSRELAIVGAISETLTTLGYVLTAQREFAMARQLFQEALAIVQEQGDRRGIAWVLNGMGRAAYGQEEYAEALAFLRESLKMRHELKEESGIADCLISLSDVVYAQGNPLPAVRLLGAVESLRSGFDVPLSPAVEARYQRLLSSQRTALGKKAFAAALAEGRAMTLDQAIALALETPGQ